MSTNGSWKGGVEKRKRGGRQGERREGGRKGGTRRYEAVDVMFDGVEVRALRNREWTKREEQEQSSERERRDISRRFRRGGCFRGKGRFSLELRSFEVRPRADGSC